MAGKKSKATGDISNKKLLAAVTQEIVGVRKEHQEDNKKLLTMLMQEIAGVRRENQKGNTILKQEIAGVRKEHQEDNKKLLTMLMQEIVDVRGELKEDIAHLDQKLTKKIDILSSDIQVLRIEVHQNQTAFMTNQDALERRVVALEVAA